MPPTARPHPAPPSAPLLWAGWFLGPLAWAVHESLSYGLVPWICQDGHRLVLHLITAGTLVVAAAGLLVGWRNRRRAAAARPAMGERAYKRARFLAAAGLALGALSLVAIVVESIPTLVVGACAR
ncbi:hypothetical protein [Azospirillum sp. ST 5-10]|uniref:hypothetical protein n=1 Tax=unclassified Azospirillum TaxID=2630922 RepID=UPI003F4A4217